MAHGTSIKFGGGASCWLHATVSSHRQQQRHCVCAPLAATEKKRNPIREIQRDLLPDGKPNTPWRRLKLKIQTAVSVQLLISIYNSNRHKTAVWRPIHAAGILMRLAALQYFKVLSQQQPADEQTSHLTLQLLDLMGPDLADAAVTRVMDGQRLAQLVVVLSRLHPVPSGDVLDPLIRELLRNKGNKLPSQTPDLLSELAAALVRLNCREQQLWLGIAAAATSALQAQAQQQQQQQQQGPWGPRWLSADYAKMAAALAAAGLHDAQLLLDLGAAAKPSLPLMSLTELAALTQAYAAAGLHDQQLLHAVWKQLPLTATRSAHSPAMAGSSSGGSRKQHAVSTAVGIAAVLHPLVQLSAGLQDLKQQRFAAQQHNELLRLVQDLIMQSGSSTSSNYSSSPSSRGVDSECTLDSKVQLLELVAQAAANKQYWKQSPLLRWLLAALAAEAVDLTPQQLSAAAAATAAALCPTPGSSVPAAMVGAVSFVAEAWAGAALLRAREYGPGVLACVLACCVTLGCYNMSLADITVELVTRSPRPHIVHDSSLYTAQQQPFQAEEAQQQAAAAWWPHHQHVQETTPLNTPAAAGATVCVLNAQQQSDLVSALHKMSRTDLAQRVIVACQPFL